MAGLMQYAVLRFETSAGEQLVLEPVRVGRAAPHPAGLQLIGHLQLPLSARMVSLSPPRLYLPGQGEHGLEEIVAGTVQAPGLIWEPGAPTG